MVLRFLRWVWRKATAVAILVALVIVLKQAYPHVGRRVGEWIAGAKDNRVTQAFSSMLSSFAEGDGVKSAVEVFRETLQDYAAS